MIVCICKGVSDREIRRAIESGAMNVPAIAARCGAGTDCGACCPVLAGMVRESSGLHPQDPARAPVPFPEVSPALA